MTAHDLFDFLSQTLQRVVGHVASLACAAHTDDEFVAVEWFANAVPLHHRKDRFFHCGEPSAAHGAFTAAPNRRTCVDQARIGNSGRIVLTKRAVHETASYPLVPALF